MAEALAAGPSRTLDEAAAVQANSTNIAAPTPLPKDLDVDKYASNVSTLDDVTLDDEDLVDRTMPLPSPGRYTFDSCREAFKGKTGNKSIYLNSYASCFAILVPYKHVDVTDGVPVVTGTTIFLFTLIGFGNRGSTTVNFQYQLSDFQTQGRVDPSDDLSIAIACDAQGQSTCPRDDVTTRSLSEWKSISFTSVRVDLSDSPPSGSSAYRPEDHVSLHSSRVILKGEALTADELAETTFRCDNARYLSPGGACIFDDVQSVHYVDLLDASIEQEAFHIYDAYNRADRTFPRIADKHIPGNEQADRKKALTRMAPTYYPDRYESNHDVAVQTCQKNFPDYVPGSRLDCDEFPYRSTFEGAYWGVDHPDDYFSYSARAIDHRHNQRAGRLLGAWYLQDRILHRDRFWVQVGCGDHAGGCGGDIPDAPRGANAPPHVDAGADVRGAEGAAVTLSGSVTDPDDTPTIEWSVAPGQGVDPGTTCTFANRSDPSTTITCTDDGTFTVTLTADDGHGKPSPVSDSATLTLANVNPSTVITSPTAGQMVNARNPTQARVTFTDPGSNDSHTCQVDFDDGTKPVTGTVMQQAGGGTCEAEHTYGFAGLGPRTIGATVTDDDGGADNGTVEVIVYVPGAGFALDASGLVAVDRTPDVRCPPNDAGAVSTLETPAGNAGTLSVTCTVSTTTGRTEVETSVAAVSLLGGLVNVRGISSSCTADASGIERRSYVGTINGIPIGSAAGSLSLPGLIEVHYNETTTDAQGRLVQNAVRVIAAGQEITVSNCRLG